MRSNDGSWLCYMGRTPRTIWCDERNMIARLINDHLQRLTSTT
jgi:hypothetical protein